MSKRILITGASGFVGGYLVEAALNRGLQVDAAIRKSSNTQYLTDPRINFVYIDMSDVSALAELLKKGQYDYIIQNAGLTRAKDPQQLFSVNTDSIRNFLEAIEQSNIPLQRFTFISSMASYGPADYTEAGIVDHRHTPHPITDYGRSKLAGEKILKASDIPYTIIRPTAVYGPRENDLLTLYKAVKKGISVHIGLKDQQLTFIHVRDLANAVLDITLNSKAERQSYFASDGNVYTTTQFMRYIQEHLGVKTFTLKIPIQVMKMVGAVVEGVGKLSGTFPPLNKEKVNELGAKSWKLDAKPFWEAASFVPAYDLDEGLKETIEWNIKEGRL